MSAGFIESGRLLWLMLVPLFGFFLFRAERRRQDLARACALRTAFGVGRIVLPLAVLTLMVVGWARPWWGSERRTIERTATDLIAVIDISLSVQATDLSPSRLEAIKRKLFDLVALAQRAGRGDRIALLPFAGKSYLFCPLTNDYRVVRVFIEALSSDLISRPGSAIAAALGEALASAARVGARQPRIVLFTDGEDQNLNPTELGRELKQRGAKITIVGVGTREGSPIPSGRGQFVRDRRGEIVHSRLNEEKLSQLAREAEGSYSKMTLDNRDIAAALAMPGEARQQRIEVEVRHEYGPWCVLVALVVVCFSLGGRRCALIALPLLLHPPLASATPSLAEAREAYQRGDYETALDGFNSAAQTDRRAEVLRALASTRFRQGAFDESARIFGDAAAAASGERERFDSLYGQGNAYLQGGRFAEAIKSYDQALTVIPGEQRAEFNRELARSQLLQQPQQSSQGQSGSSSAQDSSSSAASASSQGAVDGRSPADNSPSSSSGSAGESSTAAESHSSNSSADTGGQQEQAAPSEDTAQPHASSAPTTEPPSPKEINEREAAAWLESLDDAPVIIGQSRDSNRERPDEQEW